MPSKTQKEANYMRMALALKHGHKLDGISEATMHRLRKTAKSMTDKQLKDFSHVAKR